MTGSAGHTGAVAAVMLFGDWPDERDAAERWPVLRRWMRPRLEVELELGVLRAREELRRSEVHEPTETQRIVTAAMRKVALPERGWMTVPVRGR